MAQNSVQALTVSLEKNFAKLPSLPMGIKEFLVVVSPWLALIFGVLGIIVSLAAFGLSSIAAPFMALGGGLGVATNSIIVSVLGLVYSAFLLLAFPSLLKRKIQGWNLLFYGELAWIVYSVVQAVTGYGGILGVLVGAFIGLYLLFQVKALYK